MDTKRGKELVESSKQNIKMAEKRVETARRAAAELVISDVNLCIEFARTALDSYNAGNRQAAKQAKAAARKGYRVFLKFAPKGKLTAIETKSLEEKMRELEQALKKIRKV